MLVRPSSSAERALRRSGRLPEPAAPPLPAGLVHGRAFARDAAVGGEGRGDLRGPYRFLGERPGADDVLLGGRVARLSLQPGLTIHCTQIQDLRDLTTQTPIEPGISIVVLLAGCSDVSVGDRQVLLAVDGPGHRARGVVLATTRAETFERRWRRGRFERKVVVHLTPEWRAANGLDGDRQPESLRRFFEGHLDVRHWDPSPRCVALAEQLLLAPDDPGMLDRPRLASRAIELACEALSTLLPAADELRDTVPSSGFAPREHQRLLRVRDFLSADASAGATLTDIARGIGMSVTTLQRHFRTAFGTTVTEFRRNARLDRARVELERSGIRVAEAARQAGYTSAANFSTAFRRRFGLSPKQVRARI